MTAEEARQFAREQLAPYEDDGLLSALFSVAWEWLGPTEHERAHQFVREFTSTPRSETEIWEQVMLLAWDRRERFLDRRLNGERARPAS